MKKYNVEKLLKFCSDVGVHYGLTREAADATADVLVRTDMLGIFTHGVFSLRRYMEKFAVGGLNVNGLPEVVAEGPAWAIVDGHEAIGMYAAKYGLEVAIKKAKESGVAYVGVKNSSHSGAPGILAVEGAEQGMFTISMSNCPKNSTLPGTKGETFGNNPIAFAAPCKGRRPIFMDISCSTVAGTKIRRMWEQGYDEIPAGWAVDENGIPCTDAKHYPNLFMTFFAGHKGYCLALLVEILSAVLTGGALIDESTLWLIPENVPSTSQSFIVIDTNVLGKELFEERMLKTAELIENSPKAEGTERIFLPGDMEWERYEKAVNEGLDMPDDVSKILEELAEITGIDISFCQM